VFVSPEAFEMYKQGKRDATRFLFDAYATSVFRLVPDAETFILLLGAIGERVNTRLNDVSDQHEAELCRLKWVKLAWERAKPTAIRSVWRRLGSRWRRTVLPGGGGIPGGIDGRGPGEERSDASPKDSNPEAQPATTATAEAGENPGVQNGGTEPWHLRLRAARKKANLSRPGAAQGLRAKGIQITADAIKKHEEGAAMPRPEIRKGYELIYATPESELFPGEN
jgi:hypothetical protein